MKPLELMYQDVAVQFLVNSDRSNIMINATELAKHFGKDLFQYTKSKATKEYLSACLKPAFAGLLGVETEEDLIVSRQKSGTFMHEAVAIDFAMWLDPEFRVWVGIKIKELTFGKYKEHWDAHWDQQDAADAMSKYKAMLLTKGTPEIALKYFEAEKAHKSAANRKTRALRDQFKIPFNN